MSKRKGMTLIELVVVMAIIVVLASVLVLISPRFAEEQRTVRGAEHLQGWLLIAKQRAFRDTELRGLRLVPSTDNPKWATELLYVERPEPLYSNNYGNKLIVPGGPDNSYAQVPGIDLTAGDLVMPGDWLWVDSHETQPYQGHRINDLTVANGGTILHLAAEDGTPSLVVPMSGDPRIIPPPPAGILTANDTVIWHIYRQPRPMTGEPKLFLPRGVYVDLGESVYSGDIMFDRRGQLPGGRGKVMLEVRNENRPENSFYVVVNGATGLIRVVPVGPPSNKYQFVGDDKADGM